jgi:hypothetical protein
MTTVKELGLEPTLKEEEEGPMCSICCGELTVKNIVNPECGHATCKECFWRWAKDKNSCPFCRTSLLKNDEEAQDIQQMRLLLEHRTRIVRQVEEAYDEEENLKLRANRLKRKCGRMEEAWEGAKSLVKKEEKKLEELKQANGGTYQTFKYFKEQIVEMMCKDRRNREKIDEASMNLAHGDKGMCLEVLRDIKILGRAAGGPWEYGWFCKPKLDKVREMNKVRKERQKFRYSGELFSGWERGLRNLFQENEEDSDTDSMPELEEDSGSDMDIDHTANLILTPPPRSFHRNGSPPIITRGGVRVGRNRAFRRLDYIDVIQHFIDEHSLEINHNMGDGQILDNNMQLNAARDYTDAVRQELIAARVRIESNELNESND